MKNLLSEEQKRDWIRRFGLSDQDDHELFVSVQEISSGAESDEAFMQVVEDTATAHAIETEDTKLLAAARRASEDWRAKLNNMYASGAKARPPKPAATKPAVSFL